MKENKTERRDGEDPAAEQRDEHSRRSPWRQVRFVLAGLSAVLVIQMVGAGGWVMGAGMGVVLLASFLWPTQKRWMVHLYLAVVGVGLGGVMTASLAHQVGAWVAVVFGVLVISLIGVILWGDSRG